MSHSAELERRYRRLLAFYPPAFRHEHEQEILAVLMAGAEDGQRVPQLDEAAALIRSATSMRLRSVTSRSRPTLFWAVVLIYACAALRLLGGPILPVTHGSSPYPLDIGISWGVFALLAWGNSRGYNWARVLFTVWVGLQTVALFYDIAHLSPSSVHVWTIVGSVVFWVIECVALLLILSKRSSPYYRQPTQA
jgi:hypothetical protein